MVNQPDHHHQREVNSYIHHLWMSGSKDHIADLMFTIPVSVQTLPLRPFPQQALQTYMHFRTRDVLFLLHKLQASR